MTIEGLPPWLINHGLLIRAWHYSKMPMYWYYNHYNPLEGKYILEEHIVVPHNGTYSVQKTFDARRPCFMLKSPTLKGFYHRFASSKLLYIIGKNPLYVWLWTPTNLSYRFLNPHYSSFAGLNPHVDCWIPLPLLFETNSWWSKSDCILSLLCLNLNVLMVKLVTFPIFLYRPWVPYRCAGSSKRQRRLSQVTQACQTNLGSM